MNRNSQKVSTLDELIDLFAFGDTCEAAFIFHDETEIPEYPHVRIPLNKPDELKMGGNSTNLSEEELIQFNILAILVAFKEGKLGKGGHVI